MLEQISVTQLMEWVAFYELEPQSTFIADARTARICLAINRANGGKARFADFMPDYYNFAQEYPTDEELLRKARQMAGKR